MSTPLVDVVETSARVAATAARSTKVATLADLLARLSPDEIEPAVGYLTGEVRQGRLGVGWATLGELAITPAGAPSLTVNELDSTLDALTRLTGPGSMGARRTVLARLMETATADEGSFIFRLLGGELRQGALEGVMVEAIARAAGVPAAGVRRAHMLGGRLGPTAVAALAGGAAALGAVRLELLRPIRPMLASPAADVATAVAEVGTCSVEWKLDGARIQVHRVGDDVAVFTRNLRDITARAPEVVDAVRRLDVHTVVLDGETLTMGEDGRPRTFQDTMARFGADQARPEVLRPWFFDCLHLDGVDLIDRPLHERLAVLERIAADWRIPGIVTDDPARGADVLADALAAGHEGAMVKAVGSSYEAGRRGRSWRKVKPVHTLDLLVLAAEWGHGRRHRWLSNLHLGARAVEGDSTGSGGASDRFVMVGKTFKGLTDELLAWQTEQFLAIESGRTSTGGTVHVRPELVVEIALDGAQRSTRYPGGVALRFARVLRYRPDKGPDDVDTIDAVRALLAGAASSPPDVDG